MNLIYNVLVVIMRGLSGSGKTTLVNKLSDTLWRNHSWDSFTVSADHFFMKNGKYQFNPTQLSDAHADCFRQFLNLLDFSKQCVALRPEVEGVVIFVDNTNTQLFELTPYHLGAQSQDVFPVLLELVHPVEDCIKENTHNVPERSIRSQDEQFEEHLPWHCCIEVSRDANIEELAKGLMALVKKP